MPEVTIRYFAAARAAAGESTSIAEAASIKDLVGTVSDGRPELARVLGICTFLLDGERVEADAPSARAPWSTPSHPSPHG